MDITKFAIVIPFLWPSRKSRIFLVRLGRWTLYTPSSYGWGFFKGYLNPDNGRPLWYSFSVWFLTLERKNY